VEVSDGVTEQFAPSIGSNDPSISLSPFASRSARRKARLIRGREVDQVLKVFDFLASLRKREDGQTMAEYGVVLAVITVAVFGALALLSGNIVRAIGRVAGYIT
jgi:Flp pilus assembly pilin Flp